MKRIILPIILSALLLVPSAASADSRNSHLHSERTEKSNNGRGNSGNRGNNRGGKNHHDSNKHGNNNFGAGKNDKKGNGHNDKWNGGNSHNRPGGNGHKPQTPPPGHRPGHGSSVKAPGHHAGPRPGYGNHHHPPRLAPMVKHCVGRGRYDHVWMVGPGQYAVRFFRNGKYYMQYIWPETGRYGSPFRIIMNAPGEWYAYNNRNQLYYEEGNTLRISLNGSPMSPWTLIPSVELNINL